MQAPFLARNGAVSSGHALASLAGVEILKKGGNAFDAGVCAAMCLSILQPDYAGFVGVAPFIGYSAAEKKVICYSGVGAAPRAATIEYFCERGHEVIPQISILSQLIPASVDTWVAILKKLGTLSFGQVAAAARSIAFNGFPAHRFMIEVITRYEKEFRTFPYNASIFFQTGGIPRLGELFSQKDAARSIDLMIRAEQSALDSGKIRNEALNAVREVFYEGEIARAVDALHREMGGLITAEDLAGYHGKWDTPLSTDYKGYTVYTPCTWTQGPVLLQCLNLLETYRLGKMGHNSADYINLITNAIDLGMADREKYFGDPDFVSVPAGLWSKDYAAVRRSLIDPAGGFREIPPYGDPIANEAVGGTLAVRAERYIDRPAPKPTDTTYVCVADAEGNLFSLTPSDGGYASPMVPGYGIILGGRLTQFRLTPGHPAALAPGKRPTITPMPVVVLKDGEPFMAMGTPGADQQAQSMLQVFLNLVEFGMNIQEAIDAPRFGSYNFPGWFAPHEYYPGRICLESRIAAETMERLRELGRQVRPWGAWTDLTGSVDAVVFDPGTGTIHAGADSRRDAFPLGW